MLPNQGKRRDDPPKSCAVGGRLDADCHQLTLGMDLEHAVVSNVQLIELFREIFERCLIFDGESNSDRSWGNAVARFACGVDQIRRPQSMGEVAAGDAVVNQLTVKAA